jgi:hypothetical protein
MNQYLKVLSGAFFYGELTLGVFQKWWPPDVLLTSIYGGMGALGLLGTVHYGARYLQYSQNPMLPSKEG